MASTSKDHQISVSAWLHTIALPEYASLFTKFKFVEELFGITDNGVIEMGVQNSEHRNRIVSSLIMLASKWKGSTTSSQGGAAPVQGEPSPITTSLRDVVWFHGKISREMAENLVKQSGDFLVRESISQPGSYVLTSNHQGQALHFVINMFNSSTGQVDCTEFGFEASRFSSIQALIKSHVIGGQEITAVSHARIRTPVSRRVSISVVDADLRKARASGSSAYESAAPDGNIYQTTGGSPLSSPRKYQDKSLGRVGSVPQLNKGRTSSPNSNNAGQQLAASSLAVPTSTLHNRTRSEGELNRVASSQLPHRSGELRVTRTNTSAHPVIAIRNQALYDDGADYSDYDEVKRMPGESRAPSASPLSVNQSDARVVRNGQSAANGTPPMHQVNIPIRHQPADDGGDDYDVPAPEVREIHQFTIPIIPNKYLDVSNFHSEWLTNQNKPLDPDCMYKMKEVLLQVNYQLISQHITYLDLHLLKVIETRNLGAGIFSGIEAMTLPQGQHFREAAIERHCCLSFVVSVTILACTDDLMERSQMVKHWLLIARELLRSHGNMFSFAAIMNGVLASPIERLKMTWSILERGEPVLFNHFKTKLKSTYTGLTEAASSLSLDNVSVPYVTPVCQLLGDHMGESDEDLEISLAHLDLARLMAGQAAEYSRKGVAILRYFTPRPDLRDLFKVELHMKLLFGHRGALAAHSERNVKFKQILNILSERAESNDLGTEF